MGRIALVKMPFHGIAMPSAALSLLKSILENEKMPTDVYYFNLRFAKCIGLELYIELCLSVSYASEWLFSQCLFNGKKYITCLEDFEGIEEEYELYELLKKHKNIIPGLINEVIPKFIEECLDDIERNNYRIVGLRCVIGNQLSTLLLSKKIKERLPGVKIVFGGPNVADVMGEEILKNFQWVDYVIYGEGEEAFPALAKNIEAGKFDEELPGIVFTRDNNCIHTPRRKAPVEMDTLPTPDYRDYYKEFDRSGLREFYFQYVYNPFESSRGCWWGEKAQCRFCGTCNCDGELKYRQKSSEKVIHELMEHVENTGVKNFYAVDCVLSMDYFESFFPELIRRKLDLNIFYEVKSSLKRSDLEIMRKSGVRGIQAGVESLNTKLLKLLCKGVSAIQNIQFLKFCSEIEMLVIWNMLYKIPGEKQEYYDAIIKLIPYVIHLPPPSGGVIPISLDRFSPYFDNYQKYGIYDVKPKNIFRLIYPDKRIDLNRIAYTFDFSFDYSDNILNDYVNSLSSTVYTWQETFVARKYFCCYTVNNDYIEIWDNRPISIGNKASSYKRYKLQGTDQDVFMMCIEICSFEEMRKLFNQDSRYNGMSETVIQKSINKLRECNLLYEENGRYINLAVKKGRSNNII